MKNLSAVFCSLLFWITLKTCNYQLHHYYISLHNFWSTKKLLRYLDRWGKTLVFQIFFFLFQIMSITEQIGQDASLYIRLQHQERNSICGIRRRYAETKSFQNRRFSLSFCHWNLNNKEMFLCCVVFKPNIWVTKRC